jgi:hypothetical protein
MIKLGHPCAKVLLQVVDRCDEFRIPRMSPWYTYVEAKMFPAYLPTIKSATSHWHYGINNLHREIIFEKLKFNKWLKKDLDFCKTGKIITVFTQIHLTNQIISLHVISSYFCKIHFNSFLLFSVVFLNGVFPSDIPLLRSFHVICPSSRPGTVKMRC